jgi:hypothetical protein
MNILFVMLHAGYVRNYDAALRQLAAEGHHVHIAAELIERNKHNENRFGEQLARESPRITMAAAPVPEEGHWTRALGTSRLLVDYLRYLDPRYAQATALRARAAKIVPSTFQPLVRLFDRLGAWPAALAAACMRRVEQAAPRSEVITRFLLEQKPDLVLLTPLVEPGSIQVDYIKCARALGIPTALCVASWDNLTNKGSMRVVPDRVFVWNDAQRTEAVDLHGARPGQVVVTGAQIFDFWFDWRPSRTRDEFCQTVGLDPARPYVLYLGSSFFIAPNEAEFGQRWVTAIRTSTDPVVSQAGILIRPHPSSGRQWHGLDLSTWHHTAIWPPTGVDMTMPEFKHDFFDSMYHSAAVVGVNTSAQIEAAIVGKVVCTVQLPDFAHSQAGTLHFEHLKDLLQVSSSIEEHVAHLGPILRDPAVQAARSRRFVESFVRPFGVETAATPRLVEAIVALAGTRPAAASGPAWAGLLRPLLLPVVWFVSWLPKRRPWWVYPLRPVFHVAVQVWLLPYRVLDAWVPTRLAARRTGRRLRHQLRDAADYATRQLPRASERAIKQARGAIRHRARAVTRSQAHVARRVVQAIRRVPRAIGKQTRHVRKSVRRAAHRALSLVSR